MPLKLHTQTNYSRDKMVWSVCLKFNILKSLYLFQQVTNRTRNSKHPDLIYISTGAYVQKPVGEIFISIVVLCSALTKFIKAVCLPVILSYLSAWNLQHDSAWPMKNVSHSDKHLQAASGPASLLYTSMSQPLQVPLHGVIKSMGGSPVCTKM